MDLRRVIGVLGLGLVAVGLVIVGGFVFGVVGVPQVETVENRFGTVNASTTVAHSTVELTNPNQVAVRADDLSVDYTIAMNGIQVGTGSTDGISIAENDGSISLRTAIDNDRIPAWWYRHVSNGERTALEVAGDVSHGVLGGQVLSFSRERTVRTDVLGQFNDSTTRPIDANVGFVSGPVLFVNATSAHWGSNLTRHRTPIAMYATVYNPTSLPYALSEVDYTVRMNGVEVGSGTTDHAITVPAESRERIRTNVSIDNSRLDEWWVRHLQRGQRTILTVDFTVVLDTDAPMLQDVEPVRIDHDALQYRTSFETDVLRTDDTPESDRPDDPQPSRTSAPRNRPGT